MSRNIEQLIDLYFDGRMTAAEETDFLHLVETDPALQQLFDAEQFIRGTIGADISGIPQASLDPSAHLLSKLEASHHVAQTSNVAQQAVEQSTQTSLGSGATNVVTNVGVKGLATAGKSLIGAGMMKVAAGVLTVTGLSAGVYFASNSDPLPTNHFMRDTAIIRTLTTPPVELDTPVVQAEQQRTEEVDRVTQEPQGEASRTLKPVYDLGNVDIKGDLSKQPTVRHSDSAHVKASVQAGTKSR